MSHNAPLSIVHLDRATIGPTVILNKPNTPHKWTSYDKTDAAEIVARLQGADIAVLNKVSLDRDALFSLPDLKMIALSATGYDKIDIDACREKGVVVSNITDYAQQTVPEHTFALILALRRSITAYWDDVRGGAWQSSGQFCFFNHPIRDLKDSTIGVIGSGSIGSEVISIAKAFGMNALRAGRKGQTDVKQGFTPFDEVMEKADIITVHCPLNADTKDLIALPEFRKMAKKPLIINASRGGLVNEHDVVTALDEGLIAGAGFDVLTTEPPEDNHIIMQNLHRPNVVLTPHVAWASSQAMQVLWDQLIGHIDHFAKGTPRNQIERIQGDTLPVIFGRYPPFDGPEKKLPLKCS